MIENLRLEAEDSRGNNRFDSSITNESLAQGYNPSFTGLADPELANFSDSTTANSLYSVDGSTINTISGSSLSYRFPRYNNLNTSRRADNVTNNSANIYSYGNYYTWAAAIADTTNYTSGSHNTTSICPTGWVLPRGGNKTYEASNDFWSLIVDGINNGTKPANYESSTQPYYTGIPEGSMISIALRAYPNNFLYPGFFNSSSVDSKGSGGYYWSSTTGHANGSYGLLLGGTYIRPGTNNYNKFSGRSVRCMAQS